MTTCSQRAAQQAIAAERAQRGLIGYPVVDGARPLNQRVGWPRSQWTMPKSGSIFTDPTVAVFYPCINCRRLLAYHVDQCPHCRELIDPEQKKVLAIHSILHTGGISLANTIASGDIGVVLLSLFAIWAWWGGYQPLVAGYVVLGAFVTAAILRWNRRYGRLPFDDDEFNASRREMSRSLMIWIAFTSFAAIVFSSFWF